MSNTILTSWAGVRPPSTGNTNDVALVAGVASDAQAIGKTPVRGLFISISCDAHFNVLFGKSDVGDPADVEAFIPGEHRWEIADPTFTHFKLISTDGGDAVWWISSY